MSSNQSAIFATLRHNGYCEDATLHRYTITYLLIFFIENNIFFCSDNIFHEFYYDIRNEYLINTRVNPIIYRNQHEYLKY